MSGRHVIVVGGGIIGLAAGYRFGQRFPDARITLLEKEPRVGAHQSGHNSGVLHAGLYYKPGSSKARLAVRGIRQMVEFCEQHSIPHEICGKLVVATSQNELHVLRDLYSRGQQNGLRGLRMLEPEEIREFEPHAAGVAAIRVPEEGIADYPRVCQVLSSLIQGEVVTSAEVQTLTQTSNGWIAHSTAGDFAGDLLINCAGLQCDRVSKMAGMQRQLRIVPFRGEYYKIRPERQFLVRNLIYPVPDPKFPFLGVHYTRMISGGVEAGPNAVLAFAREGYRKRDVKARDIADALTYPGLWAFLKRYPRMCWDELRRSFSKRLFCESLQKLVPEIREDDLVTGGSGVRAQALSRNGEMVQDFWFQRQSNALHVLNAPSPGATASLAIGEEIVAQLSENA